MVGVDRVGQADGAAPSTAPTSSSSDLAELLDDARDRRARLRRRAVVRCARPSSTSTCWPQTESVFALSNGHIGLRGNLDEGEPHGLPGTYLNGCLRAAPLPYAEAGYGYPGVGPDGHQRHQRQAHPAAGRRRAVRRALRRDLRTTSACSTSAPACSRRRAEWASPARTHGRGCTSTRLVSFTQRAIAAIGYEVEAVDEPARVVVQSELVANEPRRRHAARPPRRAPPSSRRSSRRGAPGRRAAARCSCTTPATAGCGSARRMDHVIDGAERAARQAAERADDVGRVTVAAELEPGQKLRAGQVPRLRLVGAAVAARRCATRSTRRWPARSHTGWDGLLAEQRELPRRLLGARRRRGRGRRRAPAGGALRALPRAAGRRAGRAARRSRPRA